MTELSDDTTVKEPPKSSWRDRILGRGPESKEKNQILAQKASAAFERAYLQGFTEEPLHSLAEYHPPNKTFDLNKLGDVTLFRVKSTIHLERISTGDTDDEEWWDYGCAVWDEKAGRARLFILLERPGRATDQKITPRFGWESVDVFMLQRKEITKVKEINFQNSLLDWDNPEPAFSVVFFGPWKFTGERQGISYTMKLEKVEVVFAGNVVKSKSPEAATSKEISHPLAAPQPVPVK